MRIMEVSRSKAVNRKRPTRNTRKPLIVLLILVGGEEFESPTPWMSTKYSNQLN